MPNGRKDWGAIIREQLSSAQSQREFCGERGLAVASLQYHKSKGAHLEEEEERFVPISGAVSESRIEVR
ncbi:hypothetical protein MRY87_13330, partial [bacterium]|nr:hypothetical protein [bacterium]